MNKNTKILCMCQRGNCRSVATAFLLKDNLRMNDVITCGIETTSNQTKEMLFEWAELILVCGEYSLVKLLPDNILFKVVHLDLGRDMWGNPFNTELLSKIDSLLKNNKKLGEELWNLK